MANDNEAGTTALELALAWGFVGIPLLWGIYGTLTNALEAVPVARSGLVRGRRWLSKFDTCSPVGRAVARQTEVVEPLVADDRRRGKWTSTGDAIHCYQCHLS